MLRKLFVHTGAAALVIVLASASFATVALTNAIGDEGPDEQATEAPTEAPTEEPTEEPTEASTEVPGEGPAADEESGQADDGWPELSDDEAPWLSEEPGEEILNEGEGSEDVAAEPKNFGQSRSAQVREAKANGEKPGPAWQNPDHPVFGENGRKAGQTPGGRDEADAADEAEESVPAEEAAPAETSDAPTAAQEQKVKAKDKPKSESKARAASPKKGSGKPKAKAPAGGGGKGGGKAGGKGKGK